MAQFTIQEIIDLGDLSTALAGNYQEKGNLFDKRLAFTAQQTIALVTDALRWRYDGVPGDSTLRGVANYLYWLCGKFALEAQFITDGISGGGTVIPVNPGNAPTPLEFVITLNDETGTIMYQGQNTLVIPSFVGYNLLFIRNNIPQSTVDTGASFYNWDKTTGTFVCNPDAVEGELFQLYPFL